MKLTPNAAYVHVTKTDTIGGVEFHSTPDTGDVPLVADIDGDPAHVPWLIDQMHQEKLARIAGEAFSMITGVDIDLLDLDGEALVRWLAEPIHPS